MGGIFMKQFIAILLSLTITRAQIPNGRTSVSIVTGSNLPSIVESPSVVTVSKPLSVGGTAPVFVFPTEAVPLATFSLRMFPGSVTGGVNDASWWGYNVSPTPFTPKTNSEPMLFFGLESNYTVLGTMEAYLRFMPIGQSGNNFKSAMFFDFDRTTGHVLHANFNADSISFNSGDATTPTLQYLIMDSTKAVFGTNVVMGSTSVSSSDLLNIGSPGGGTLKFQDTTSVTGGALRMSFSGVVMAFNTYDAALSYTGTPLTLSATRSLFVSPVTMGSSSASGADALNLGTVGGATIRIQDLTAVTGGAIRMSFTGTALAINTYSVAAAYTGTPLQLSSTFVKIGVGGLATKIACYKGDGQTLGYATMAVGDISACN